MLLIANDYNGNPVHPYSLARACIKWRLTLKRAMHVQSDMWILVILNRIPKTAPALYIIAFIHKPRINFWEIKHMRFVCGTMSHVKVPLHWSFILWVRFWVLFGNLVALCVRALAQFITSSEPLPSYYIMFRKTTTVQQQVIILIFGYLKTGGGGSSEPPEPPLDPPLIVMM